jgi:hypothetical protein
MAGPGDEKAAAAGRGHLRASHADRDHVINTLKVAFVQGRLTRDEFDLRVSQTLTSRTYADLAALTGDLPAGLARAEAPRRPVRAQPPVNKPLMWSTGVIALMGVMSMVAAFPTGEFLLLVAGVLAVLICAPVAGILMLDSWREKPPGGQLPPWRAQPGQALEGEQGGSIGNDLILSAAPRGARARHVPAPAV